MSREPSPDQSSVVKVPEIVIEGSLFIRKFGVAVYPEITLPSALFGRIFRLEIELPDGTVLSHSGAVESMLISPSRGEELFTYRIRTPHPIELPKGTKIRAVEELRE